MSFEQIENFQESAVLNESKEKEGIFEIDRSWENDPKNIDVAQRLAYEKLLEMGWDEDQAGEFSLAVAEAMANAILHGNLGVNRKDGPEDYIERIKEAQEKDENKEKRAEMYLCFTKDEATARIKDAGNYVPEAMVDPTTGEYLLKGSERGLYLIGTKVDDLEFFPGEIIFKKRRKANVDGI
jgi:hypothetical protein